MTQERHNITIEEILSLYKERIRYITLAYSYVKDYSTAEDIFSQCIFKLTQTKDSVYIYNLKFFFASAIKNSCINYLLRQKKECELKQDSIWLERFDVEIARLVTQTSHEEFTTDFPGLLEKCKKRMPDLTYEVFMAKRLDRMSYKEIGERFKISTSRINFEINRALKIFRDVFKDYLPFIILLAYSFLLTGGGFSLFSFLSF